MLSEAHTTHTCVCAGSDKEVDGCDGRTVGMHRPCAKEGCKERLFFSSFFFFN